MSGVARRSCKNRYNTPEFYLFFESLQYIVELDRRISGTLTALQKKTIIQDMYDAIDLLDIEYKAEQNEEPRSTRVGTVASRATTADVENQNARGSIFSASKRSMLISTTSFKESMQCELSEHSSSTLLRINEALEDVKKDGK